MKFDHRQNKDGDDGKGGDKGGDKNSTGGDGSKTTDGSKTNMTAYPAGTCGAHMWGKQQHGSKCGNRVPYDDNDPKEQEYLRSKHGDDAMSCCKPPAESPKRR